MIDFLDGREVKPPGLPSNGMLLSMVEHELEINNCEIGKWERFQIIEEMWKNVRIPVGPTRKARLEKKRRKLSRKAFYDTDAWRQLRYRVLTKYGKICMVCGRTPEDDGVTMHVDHIKPRSKHPELELAEDNLQVLCEDCNMGKGAWDETDWRGPRLAAVMGERVDGT